MSSKLPVLPSAPSGHAFRLLTGALFAALTLLALPFASRAAGPPTVAVHADQPEGRFISEKVTNVSVDSIYAQTTSPLSENALDWLRASNAVSYVRCYNWLGDAIPKRNPEWFSGCRVARTGPNGAPVYQWDALEQVLDTLLSAGVRPFIVCGAVPDALAAGPLRRNESGAAVNRPKDYAQYQDMLTQMFKRLEKTYGAKEVRTWYFEAWGQPDHEGSWEGGRPAPFKDDTTAAMVEPFNKLYDRFAAAANAVDAKLRIGGPGLAGDRGFLRHFLAHCARGANTAGSQKGARLDFVSWCAYGSVPEIIRQNSELRGLVESGYPELKGPDQKGLEFILSESGPGPGDTARASTVAEAARLASLTNENARAARGMDMLFRSGDLADYHFDGYQPLITQIGENTVQLPAFRLYSYLSRMSSQRVRAEAPEGVGVLATRSANKELQHSTQVLLYRYDPTAAPGGSPLKVKVHISGLATNLIRLPMQLYRVDSSTHAVYETWEAAGKPTPAAKDLPGDKPDTQAGAKAAALLQLGKSLLGDHPLGPDQENANLVIRGGEADVEVSLPVNSVVLITLGAEPTAETALCERGERLRRAEQDYAAAVELRTSGDRPRAEEAFRKLATKYADTYWRKVALFSLLALYRDRPAEATDVRKELLALPINDVLRIRLLEEVRVAAVRSGGTAEAQDLTRQIQALEEHLKELRQWPLRRYRGE